MRLTRQQLLQTVILQAAANGFEFPRWWARHMQTPWPGRDVAFQSLAMDKRYYSLLFSHPFARAFWKHGSRMTFLVPGTTYSRRSPSGDIVTVVRKPFTRRTLRADAWLYHLREMAAAEEPLRYIRRFLVPGQGQDAAAVPSRA